MQRRCDGLETLYLGLRNLCAILCKTTFKDVHQNRLLSRCEDNFIKASGILATHPYSAWRLTYACCFVIHVPTYCYKRKVVRVVFIFEREPVRYKCARNKVPFARILYDFVSCVFPDWSSCSPLEGDLELCGVFWYNRTRSLSFALRVHDVFHYAKHMTGAIVVPSMSPSVLWNPDCGSRQNRRIVVSWSCLYNPRDIVLVVRIPALLWPVDYQ